MGTAVHDETDARLEQPSVEERRALIERVAGSLQFRRSARLRDFLLYVGRQSLKDGRSEIHEQEIGAKVFGRPPSYDRSQDNIVRVNATELRKRIDLYFAGEGAGEPLILEIPRGGYMPVFHRRAEVAATAVAMAPLEKTELARMEPAVPIAGKQARSRQWVWMALCVMLGAACVYLGVQNRTMRGQIRVREDKPTVALLWSELTAAHAQTDVVLPDASVSTREDMVAHPLSLADYLNHRYGVPPEVNVSADRRADVDALFAHHLVAFGDFQAAQQILAVSSPGSTMHLTLSRLFTAESLKRDSVILIGGQKANPWVQLFDDRMNFSLDNDSAHGRTFVANRQPRAGEQASYSAWEGPTALDVGYSVVAYLPNPSRTGNVLIFAGTDANATSAAAEFLTSEEQLAKFRKTLGVSRFPYFEALLKTSRVMGTSFSAEMLAYRVYPDMR
jgi:hypothetical protein